MKIFSLALSKQCMSKYLGLCVVQYIEHQDDMHRMEINLADHQGVCVTVVIYVVQHR